MTSSSEKNPKHDFELDLTKMGMNTQQHDWRNFEIEVTDIRDDNLKAISDTKVFKNTFKSFPVETISSSQNQNNISLGWEYYAVLISAVLLICSSYFFFYRRGIATSDLQLTKHRNSRSKQISLSSTMTLSETLTKLNEVTRKDYHFHSEDKKAIELISHIVESLFQNLMDNYDVLETSEACEVIMTHIDTLLYKINKQANTFEIEHYIHHGVDHKAEKLKNYRTVERIKQDLAELRTGLTKMMFIDERKFKSENYTKLQQAISFNNINCMLDYTMLLAEYGDTAHSLYTQSCVQIDVYYRNEENRLRLTSEQSMKKHMNDISGTFEMMSIIKNSSTSDSIATKASDKITKLKTICETSTTTSYSVLDVLSPLSDCTSPAIVEDSSDLYGFTNNSNSSLNGNSNSSSSGEVVFTETVAITTTDSDNISITAESTSSRSISMNSSQVTSLWALELLKVKREANDLLTSKLEALQHSRVENEHRARNWARNLVEERRREIYSSKLFLETLKEQRMAHFTHSSIHHNSLAKELHAEFADEKRQQYQTDRFVLTVVAVAVAVVYIAVYAGWDPTRGDLSWNAWLWRNIQRTCSLIECQVASTVDPNIATSAVNSNNINLPPRRSSIQLTGNSGGSGGGSGSSGSGSSGYSYPVLSSLSYFSSYFSLTSSFLYMSPMTYLLSTTLPYVSIPADILINTLHFGAYSSTKDWQIVGEYMKCGMFFVFRAIPVQICSKLGLPKMFTLLVALYTFSDLLLRILLGPLLPLFWLTVLQQMIFYLIQRSDRTFAWNVRGVFSKRNVRPIVLYILYPLLLLFLSSWLSCVYNINRQHASVSSLAYNNLFDGTICTYCVYNTWERVYSLSNAVLMLFKMHL